MIRLSPLLYLYATGSPPPPSLPINGIAFQEIHSEAFGDGTHPTTRLCAGAIDFLCRQGRAQVVLDVGTGTGILARIARARGAQFVAGTDIDPNALKAAAANASLDGHSIEMQLGGYMPDHWGARFDLVVANILEGPLRELAPALGRALAPQGTLLLSGFTRLQIPTLRLAFTEQGLAYASDASLDDWALLMFRK
jgi:ribosomal protein L11 methyltransferase